MKIAIVHEWLSTYAGSEKVLEQMLNMFPESDLFCIADFLSPEDRKFLKGKTAKTTFIQKLPFARKFFRHYLALMPIAVEQLDVSGYDLIISSNHALAKCVITGPDQIHISYTYTPIRYAWDLQGAYLAESGLEKGLLGAIVRLIMHYIRICDARASFNVDHFVAISSYIGRRILKAYRRPSAVIYPPVDTSAFELREDKSDFYVTASRMVPYKKIPLIVQAFSEMADRRLIVIGDGPDMARCLTHATPNVQLMGYQEFAVLKDHLQRAKAFIFAAEEDFGISPLEAQACGTPVIAFARGGATETIRGLDHEDPTGVFFHEQSVIAIKNAVVEFESNSPRFSAQACRENALRFSIDSFTQQFGAFVTECARKYKTSNT